jgi:hypothetical protein
MNNTKNRKNYQFFQSFSARSIRSMKVISETFFEKSRQKMLLHQGREHPLTDAGIF